MRSIIAVLSILTLSGAAFVQAESLGEVAAREKEKRKGKKEEPVVTETELARAKGRGVSMTDGGMSSPAPAPAKEGEATAAKPGDKTAPKEKTPEELAAEKSAEKEKDWRARLDKETGNVAAIQARIAQLESTPGLYNDAGRTAQLAGERASLAAAQANLVNLQDEGRRGFR